MNLVVDVGNTRVKYAFYDGEKLVNIGHDTSELEERVRNYRATGKSVDVLLAGSGKIDARIRSMLKVDASSLFEMRTVDSLPIGIDYDTPRTLGMDRVASCVGANYLYPGVPLLVIDLGTAITFDYVSAEGVFLGGNISPGVEVRFRALNEFTAHLPYVSPVSNYGTLGKTTKKAILNGVMLGVAFELNGYIQRFIDENSDGVVVITGGGSPFFANKVSDGVKQFAELGLLGLNKILESHLNNKRVG